MHSGRDRVVLTLLLGGARSGKSTAAVRMAAAAGGAVSVIATSPRIEGDDDLDARIAAHQAERPTEWTTIETETELAAAIETVAEGATILIDCVTVWVGNLLHHGADDNSVRAAARAAIDAAARRDGDTIVVSNEVGLGIVPADAATRRYRDLLGRVNQAWADAADRSFLLVAGRALRLDASISDPGSW